MGIKANTIIIQLGEEPMMEEGKQASEDCDMTRFQQVRMDKRKVRNIIHWWNYYDHYYERNKSSTILVSLRLYSLRWGKIVYRM